MENGCSVLRTASTLSSSHLKVGSAMLAILSYGISGWQQQQYHYAKSQHTPGYHLRRRGSNFRALRRPLKDLHSRQKRGEGPKDCPVELHVAVGCCRKDDSTLMHCVRSLR